jgi:hypothetical protein
MNKQQLAMIAIFKMEKYKQFSKFELFRLQSNTIFGLLDYDYT